MNISLLRPSASISLPSFSRTLFTVFTLPTENYRAPYNVENFEKPPIWADPKYARQFKGHIAPKRTTRNCYIFQKGIPIKKKKLCAVCDNKPKFEYTDVEFIKNFICPLTHELIHCALTGVCRYQQQRLMREMHKAQMSGFIMIKLPRPELDWLKHNIVPK